MAKQTDGQAKTNPLADRRIMAAASLGPCPRCGREVGTMGFWSGARYGEGAVICDGCALGWPAPAPVTEVEAQKTTRKEAENGTP